MRWARLVGLALGLGLAGGLGTTGTLAATLPPSDPIIVVSRLSSRCMVPEAGAANPGTRMVQRICTGAANETWKFVPVVNGYRLVSQATGLCLAVAGDPKKAGNNVVQAACVNNSVAQTWRVLTKDKWRAIQLRHSGFCIGVYNGSRSENTKFVQTKCSSGDAQKFTLSRSTLPALWTPKMSLPTIPVAAANLPDGRVLAWSAYDRFNYGGAHGMTFTTVIDPVAMSATETLVSETGHDMFCPGTTLLPDGRLLVNGGSNADKTSIYDPATGIWSSASPMNIRRGYQGNTLTSRGEVLTLGGSWSGGRGGKHGELWDEGGGWRKLSGVPVDPFLGPDPGGIFRADNHIWLAAWRDGWVFHAGPSAAMHWVDTKGFGNVKDAGPRGADPYAMNGNAIVFDVGKMLTVGGAPAYSGSTANATDTAYVVDFSGGPDRPVVATRQAPMTFPRALHNSVVLPNGEVIVIGGMNQAAGFSDRGAVLMPELWSPVTGRFTRLAPMTTARTYHSIALLLLDGRVMAGGGGLCGADCVANHPDFEILTPPYLLNADGTPAPRPELVAASASALLGETISVVTSPDAVTFALVRMAAATHSVNNDQRRIPLPVAGGTANAGFSLTIPDDPGVVLPGNYMLFALDAAGHPSVAKVINLRPAST